MNHSAVCEEKKWTTTRFLSSTGRQVSSSKAVVKFPEDTDDEALLQTLLMHEVIES